MYSPRNVAAVAAIALISSLQGAFSRDFEDKFGRVINAELVSHAGAKGETVKIRKGGKEMNVKVSLFSEKDQQFIREWMKETPPTVDYSFRVAVERKEPKPAEPAGAGEAALRNAPTVETFDLKLTNLTRATVSGLKVEYRLYYKDYPSSLEDLRSLIQQGGGLGALAGRRGRNVEIEPELEHIQASVDVEGELEYNKTATIESKPLEIHSGKNPLAGDSYKDEVVGFIIRVYEPGGKMVFEHRDKKAKDFLWEVEDLGDEFGIKLD